jgi:type VI secretion system protein ImpC
MDTSSDGTIGASFSHSAGGEAMDKGSPLRLVVLSDFGCGHEPDRPPTRVDRDSFQQVLRSFGPKLRFNAPDHLSGQAEPLKVELSFSELKDFTPAAITDQLPALSRARDVLVALDKETDPQKIAVGLAAVQDLEAFCRAVRPQARGGAGGAGARADGGQGVRQRAEEPRSTPRQGGAGAGGAAPSTPEQQTAVGRILDMVDAGEPDDDTRSAAAAAVGQFISKISGSAAKAKKGGASPVTEAAEALFSRQLEAVLHHPDVRRTESAWRGLKFLVDRTDFRSGVLLEVLDTRRDALLETFEGAVYRPEMDGTADVVPALILLDFQLENTPGDLQLLEALGARAEEIQAPVLFSVGASFFGLEPGGRMPFIDTLLEQPEYTKWNALRDKGWSRWLAAAFNGFALRLPHDEDKPPRYREAGSPPWGSPVWAVASLVSASFARVGWPTEVTGIEAGRVDDLPLAPGRHHPLELLLPQELANDLTAAGFIPLFSPAQSDSGFVFRAPTLHRAPRGGRLTSSLPYQLLAARLATAILAQKGRLAGMPEPEIQATLEGLVENLLADTGRGAAVKVSVSEDPEQPARLFVMLELRTGKSVLGGAPVDLGFRI